MVGSAARKGYSVVHATGSKAFTTNLRGIVGRRELFRYFNDFTREPHNSLDLVVCDEAHRLRESSRSRFHRGSGHPQVGEIIDSAKVALFLLDERQTVRADEIGSVSLIENYASTHNVPLSRYNLGTQSRCAGSDSYIRWVDHLFGYSPLSSLAWKRQEEYEVRIFDDLVELEAQLKLHARKGLTARLVAGFCASFRYPRPILGRPGRPRHCSTG